MINHVVLFKLKDYPEAEKKEVRNKIKAALEALKDKIAELQYIEVGLNETLNSPSFDICLITHFNNLTDLNVYSIHPEHLKVAELIKASVVSRAAVDYQF